MPNSVMGETVHAAILLRHPPSTPVTPQQLIAWCQSQLALYKCPTAVHTVEELPTTGSGKVLKNVLRATFTRGSGSAAAAATMPVSAGPLLAVAAAAAEAAVDVVASHGGRSASDGHTPFRGSSVGEQDKDADMLDAITAQCPGACFLDAYSDGLVMDSGECYLLVVGNWATAVTQVPPLYDVQLRSCTSPCSQICLFGNQSGCLHCPGTFLATPKLALCLALILTTCWMLQQHVAKSVC